MSQTVFVLYAIFSPVIYATLAGRANMNLIDTEEWHRWSFRIFSIGLVCVTIFWFTSVGLHCPDVRR